jgi:hypothetical protein
MSLMRLATVTVIATTCCVSAACSDTAHTAPAETLSITAALACEPVKIAVIADRSKSAPGTRTPPLTVDDVQALVDLVASCGGELAVGVIHDRITDPFVRLRLDVPPLKPADSQARNVIQRRREQADIDLVYDKAVQAWTDEANERAAMFEERVRPLLDHSADAAWSPVWDAVARGDLFLAERETGAAVGARRVLILVSDAVDDVPRNSAQRRAPIRELKSGATVLVVNGAGSAGSLAALAPEPFESFDSAVRYIDALVTSTQADNK